MTSTPRLREDDSVCEQMDRIGVAAFVEESSVFMDVSSADPDGSNSNSHNSNSNNDSGDEDGDRPSAPKKRRLELPSAWTNLVGQVVSLKTSPEVAPWLQLIDEWLNLFPDSPNLHVS